MASPALVTLFGELPPHSRSIAESWPDMTPEARRRALAQNPELLGIWPWLVKAAAGVAKGVKGIAKAVKKSKASKKAAGQAKAANVAAQNQAIADAAAAKKKKMMMIAAGAVAAVAVVGITLKGKRK